MKNFKEVNPRQSFPKLEEEILSFWKENKIFEKSIENRADAPEFNFYDGPPFATGTPHYGHILAGTIKDVIPRYQTMNGFRVDRKFGWDCHGLPIENIVEKKMNISGKDDIEKRVGVYEFNEACRSNVFGYVEDWKKTVDRMGRWVDMENSYKTMDSDFMESVWWVYKSLYEKGLIYEGHRVVPYCPRCSTPLSNFEVNQGYKDKQDKTVTVKFKVVGSTNKYILVWTTTPWTLVSNLGIAVGVDLDYVELLDKKTSETYVLAKDRISSYYKNDKVNSEGRESTLGGEDYTIVREYKGACLVGIRYEPIFDDFFILNEANSMPLGMELGKNVWSIVPGHHVTTDSGTGIVHMAPAYGEDDNLIGKEQSLGFVAHIADNGNTENLLTDNGIPVFEYNELAISRLKEKNVIFLLNTFDHSYPHCWRCDTPLIYRAISAWYVAVEKIRDKMVENNQEINWTPEIIKNGRFGKWVEGAKDWNISRNRYWGSAIPVWQNEDKSSEVCVGSIAEMYELNKDFGQIERRPHPTSPLGGEEQKQNYAASFSPKGERIQEGGYKYYYTNTNKEVDIHKHFVDEIKLKHPKTGEILKRVPEVLDCWFESGAMPYASKHYPFENKSHPELDSGSGKNSFKFPGDFIAEGLDQTRGWFYTLLILGTALFEKAPMKNVIVNGIVLAEDGQKMSKSKKNYPDPQIIFDNYGADAMRFYLMNSPVVEAQDLRFAEAGVEEVVKKVILPLWNTYSFFTTYANIDNFTPSPSKERAGVRSNNLDKWLISELNELTKEVGEGFDGYKLNEAAKPIVKFMDNLTNWYIRRSRKRFWKSENDNDKLEAYETLYFTLVETCKIIAPFMPFVSEYIYKNLTSEISVHLTDFPKYDESLINLELNKDTDLVQKVITLGLAWRANQKIRVRQPLKSITITFEISDYYKEIIKEELNVKEVIVVEGTTLARKICKPNGRTIGPKFGSNVKFIINEAKAGNFIELKNGNVVICHPELDSGTIEKIKLGLINDSETSSEGQYFILETGDFELVYESGSSENAIEAGFGMVISMDSNITPELKKEGFARDIVRHIQEARKEADYKVDDRIKISFANFQDEFYKSLFGKTVKEMLDDKKENWIKNYIETETLSTIVDNLETFEINKDLEIEDLRINLRLKK